MLLFYRDETTHSGLVKAFLQKEEELRLSLAHNLARAIVAEGTSDDKFSIAAA